MDTKVLRRRINDAVKDRNTVVLIPRDVLGLAELEFQRLIVNGKIVSATSWPTFSTVGSASYLVVYPS